MKVIAIDIDGTALKYPDKVNSLYMDYNNLIVLYTARGEEARNRTIKELLDKNIMYHILQMGKLNADIFIDDKNAGGLNWDI